jgi:UDP-N-acetyl-D-glucosamine dehydrogenase
MDVLAKIRERTARVAILGQGYVGLVVSMRASEAGFAVLGFEVDEGRTSRLRAGDSFVEDVPNSVLEAALHRGYRASNDLADLAGFDVAVITVPTPLSDGLPDLSYIERAARSLAPHARPGCLVVLESTTYPGTTEELVKPLLEEGSGLRVGDDLLLGYSPERIDPGNPTFSLHNTPKVVSGVDRASLAAVSAFFGSFVEQVVPVSGTGEAELAKVLENTFRHVNIALVNELAVFAHALGIDAREAIDAAATKPFGFMAFSPGPGVGGHCLPIDPTYLSWRVKRDLGENFRFIELANDVNEHMPQHIARRVTSALNRDRKPVNGSTIVVLGISYKPNVGDARESPALPLIELLVGLDALVVAVDPHVEERLDLPDGVVQTTTLTGELLERADIVLVVTDHDAFDYDEVARRSRRILDTRHRLQGSLPNVERL